MKASLLQGVVKCPPQSFIFCHQSSSTGIDVLSTRLRRGDSLSLLRCSGDVSDEAGDTDLAAIADGDVSPDALVAADQISPLCVAFSVILNNESIIRKVGKALN